MAVQAGVVSQTNRDWLQKSYIQKPRATFNSSEFLSDSIEKLENAQSFMIFIVQILWSTNF
jgi:hypothetical protein